MTVDALGTVQAEMLTCRRCLEEGYPIAPGAVFSGASTARLMIIGQAPGRLEASGDRPFSGPAGRRLFHWLARAGWEEAAFRAIH